MEKENIQSNKLPMSHKHSGRIFVAILLIAGAALLITHNLGILSDEYYRILFSWQAGVTALGIYSLFRRHYISGILVTIIGVFSILSLFGVFPPTSPSSYIAIVMAVIGCVMLLKKPKHHFSSHSKFPPNIPGNSDFKTDTHTIDGYINSNNRFGGVRHVVVDEYFKGASVFNLFGGTIIDLTRTHLKEGETIIYIDCQFGGVEIYVPDDWKVALQCDAFIGGCEDKRILCNTPDMTHTLIIRGQVSFGGIEIKPGIR